MHSSVDGSGFLGFWRQLFRRRDRVVFITAKSPAAARAADARKAETTAKLRRVVAAAVVSHEGRLARAGKGGGDHA